LPDGYRAIGILGKFSQVMDDFVLQGKFSLFFETHESSGCKNFTDGCQTKNMRGVQGGVMIQVCIPPRLVIDNISTNRYQDVPIELAPGVIVRHKAIDQGKLSGLLGRSPGEQKEAEQEVAE
jgi:hypothetical protein